MRDLFAAARNDAPASAVRDQVWERVAAVTAAPAVTAAVKAATPTGAKLLAAGAVIGAMSTAVVVILLSSSPRSPGEAGRGNGERSRSQALAASAADEASPSPVVAASERAAGDEPRGPVSVADSRPSEPKARHPVVPSTSALALTAPHDEASALAKEASIITEARMALVRGEPERALALVRSTRRLPARALEPEELALEARTLRALGRTDDALATELTLRRRFPDHALSR